MPDFVVFELSGPGVQRVVDVGVGRGVAGGLRGKLAGVEDVVGAAVGGVEIVGELVVRDFFQRVGVLPGVAAGDVDGHALFQEPGAGAVLQRPVVPRLAQGVLGDEGVGAELEAADLVHRSADAAVVPGADHEVVHGLGRLVAVAHVHAVVLKRAALVAVVVAGDGQDGDVHRRELLGGWGRGQPVLVRCGVLHPGLEARGQVTDDPVEFGEGTVVEVALGEGIVPQLRVAEDRALRRVAAGEGQPGHVVGDEHVVHEGEIGPQIGRGRGHDRFQAGRQLLRGRPLVPPAVRGAVHGHLAVRPRLRRQPFDDVVAVLVRIVEGLEFALGVAAPANVHGGEDIPPLRVVAGLAVVDVADVGGEAEDDGARFRLVGRAVDGTVEVGAVPHGDGHAPLHADIGELGSGGRRNERYGRTNGQPSG